MRTGNDMTEKLLLETGEASRFSKTLAWLKIRWQQKKDSACARIILPLIFHDVSDVDISLIGDSVQNFKKYYKEGAYATCPDIALQRACLCGSKRVTEFLLEELHLSYLSEGCENLLSYVAASPNDTWAKEIAKALATAGKEIPDSIYGLASNDQIIFAVLEIFKKKPPLRSPDTLKKDPVSMPFKETPTSSSSVIFSPGKQEKIDVLIAKQEQHKADEESAEKEQERIYYGQLLKQIEVINKQIEEARGIARKTLEELEQHKKEIKTKAVYSYTTEEEKLRALAGIPLSPSPDRANLGQAPVLREP